jgi:flagellar basal-body rod modification protein FlgD
MEVNPLLAQPPLSATESSSLRLGDDLDSFLKLLTVQLQNQDPLSPMDSTEFTNQLVQFSSVEQAIATNNNLESLIDMQKTSQAAAMVGYIGKTIEASGNQTALSNGTAEFSYDLASPAAQTIITIFNENGELMFTTSGESAKGRHVFAWDGIDGQDIQQPDGVYHMVVTARDADDQPIAVATSTIGPVEGVIQLNGETILEIAGGIEVNLAEVLSVRQSDTGTTP